MQSEPITNSNTQAILRRSEVERATGLSRSTLYDKMAAGQFPKPVPLCGRAVGWLSNEIAEWQRARIAERDGAKAA
jgi:prophage regulatory protein